MDRERFDALTRLLATTGSRRKTLGVLLAAAVAGGHAESLLAARKRKRRHGRPRGNKRVRSQQAPAGCFPGSPTGCIPGPKANLSTCDFEDSNSLENVNCTSCNLSGANLQDADASGANFNKANLQKACLVDADLTGATINASTNLKDALFCRTTMPNGSINNSGCSKGTNCCPTCDAEHPCGSGQVCCNGRCQNGECCRDADCPSGLCCARTCCDAGQVCNTGPNPDACCTPGGTCPAGFCGSIPDGCGGTIACPCTGGLTCCGETCIDTSDDANNCGACGNRCAPWQTCDNGACTPTCASRCSAPCTFCYTQLDGNVVCGGPILTTCNEFPCTATSCGPAGGGTCTLSSTSVATNETEPICEQFGFVAQCVSQLGCA